MNEREVRRLLNDVSIPGESEMIERALRVSTAAFAAREPILFPRRHWRGLVAATAAAVLAGVFATPPGTAVVNSLRDAIGRTRITGRQPSMPDLIRLPTSGSLLINAAPGAWVVPEEGARRLLGPYRDASWSPHGLYVAAGRVDDLVVVDPHGRVQWSLPHRSRVRLPRWSPDGYRIAYLSGSALRASAGDGTADHFLARAATVAPAWYPSESRHLLAFVDRRHGLRLIDADSGRTLWRTEVDNPTELAWTADGHYLLSVSARRTLSVLSPKGHVLRTYPVGTPRQAALAISPISDEYALANYRPSGESTVTITDVGRRMTRRVFSGVGRFTSLAWSPDGTWLALGWMSADQLLFIRAVGRPEIRAVSRLARQFDPAALHPSFPSLAGWCCRASQK